MGSGDRRGEHQTKPWEGRWEGGRGAREHRQGMAEKREERKNTDKNKKDQSLRLYSGSDRPMSHNRPAMTDQNKKTNPPHTTPTHQEHTPRRNKHN